MPIWSCNLLMFRKWFPTRPAQTQQIASSTPKRASNPNIKSPSKAVRSSQTLRYNYNAIAAQQVAELEMKRAKNRIYSKKYYEKVKSDPVELERRNARRRELRAHQIAIKKAVKEEEIDCQEIDCLVWNTALVTKKGKK